MGLPLDGIKVLDLASMWAVPGAAMYLADQGAEVLKVEPPQGDECRRVLTLPAVNGESRAHWMINRNKRAISIDLRSPQGREVLHRLVREADVLLHNYRPGVPERIGADYATLSALNPRLIYVAFSPYGAEGPHAGARGYDLLVQAASGILGRRSMPDGSPRSAGIWAVDMATSPLLAYAVTLALIERGRTGRGQRVDGSLLAGAIALQMVELIRVQGREDPPSTQDLGTQAVFSAYRCADGRFVQLVVVSDKEWAILCTALERDALAGDPRFATQQARGQNSAALYAALAEAIAARSASEWSARFLEHDVAGMAVLAPEEVFDSPQASVNAMFVTVEQPGAGRAEMMNVPFRLGGAAGGSPRPMRAAPRFGEHTDAVLREAGYTPEEIAALRAAGAVH
jgi:crotonobetainyl-CoA:carnitine CoA-transferase CaiB-like acyl-CoA transferase